MPICSDVSFRCRAGWLCRIASTLEMPWRCSSWTAAAPRSRMPAATRCSKGAKSSTLQSHPVKITTCLCKIATPAVEPRMHQSSACTPQLSRSAAQACTSWFFSFGLGPVLSRTTDLVPVAQNTGAFLRSAYLFNPCPFWSQGPTRGDSG